MYTHQTVHSCVRLTLNITTLLLAVLHSSINETGVARLSRRLENERWVGSSILGLVDIDSCARVRSASSRPHLRLGGLTLKVTGVRHDNGAGLLELVESGGHGGRR